ncbi:SycD/LcrH family type III secretion system chaperone [Bordetella sp. BOR01]|uniref:SycD/LcrH family type III secretion system chaperone n=1 Tax=Bordetella sp. BOR01 TaxID=2854779 RepID=UPI001C45FEFC|nr:SycD/LcrH family type III secretion system chaperone [Bordetella sp. BOR01]MBV7485207.1 SycD/LcrH family type III secretion system chaperone [Bordetella sp. BOR01]
MTQNAGYTPEEFAALHDQIVDTFARGGTLADLRDISDDECEALYTLGHGLYEKGRYADALKVLGYLVALNHSEHRYLVALGATAQALGKYRDAVQQYMAATLLDPLDPTPVFYTGQCMLELNQYAAVIESCDLAIAMCKGERHAVLLERAKAMRATAAAKSSKES